MLYFRVFQVTAYLLTGNRIPNVVNSFCTKKIKPFDKTNLDVSTKIKRMPMEVPNEFTILPSPFKSASDKKDYRVIQLKNGLKACLVSDTANIVDVSSKDTLEGIEEDSAESSVEESSEENEEHSESEEEGGRPKHKVIEQKMAAAGLCVGVGSFSDPKEIPGMAHFLEHMVFMGSEKFPEENDFDSFLKKSGGNNNASTDTETTCFYFECLEEHLFMALDKFAQFFIAPLMKKGAMTREREAIESEFQMALPSDSSRREQLLFSFAKYDSPVNSFSWGNLITLRDNISDDVLYNGVHNFRKRHYSAHRMTLAIQARLPLDTLQEYVLQCFQNVSNNNLPPDDFSQFKGNVLDTPEFYKMYYVKPNKDLCEVDLTWSLPPLFDQYKCNPIKYLSHLLGDEGPGSIAAYLRKKLWAITINCGNSGSGDELNSMYSLFTVSVVLTDKGMDNLLEVIETIFSYINLLKTIGPQEQIYNELKTITDTGFKFAREENAADLVEDLCEIMQYFPPEDYLTSDDVLYQYDPQVIKMVTDSLSPDKVNIVVMTSKDLPNGLTYNQTEKWFGTKYVGLDIPADWLKKLSNIPPYSELAIPTPNPYLTGDFSLLPETVNHPDYPEKILSTPMLEVWYRKDQKFKLPLGYYFFYLISPLPMDSVKNAVLLDMMMNILTFSLAEKLYPASNADLNYSCLIYEKGICIKVFGYNEKLPLIVDVISQQLLNLNDNFCEELFKAIKETLLKNYYNKLLKPSTLAKDIRLQLLVDKYWPPADKFTALKDITYEEMTKFVKKYMEILYLKVLVQGNVSQEIVTEISNKLVKDFNYTQLTAENYPKFRVFQVPNGEKCVRVEGFNKRDANSIVTNYYQCAPFSLKSSVIIDIIMLIIEEPLFDTLRTKEQLGYHVYCSSRDTFGILGYTITVNAQVTKFSTSYIDNRIEEFLKNTQKILRNMNEKDLEEIKQDLIKTKEFVDVHLKEEVSRNWSEIINDEYMFDRHIREIEMIKKITIKQVREWWSNHNRFGTKINYRKISFQVVGHANKESSISEKEKDTTSAVVSTTLIGNAEVGKQEKKENDYFISSIQGFKDNAFLYPAVTILP